MAALPTGLPDAASTGVSGLDNILVRRIDQKTSLPG